METAGRFDNSTCQICRLSRFYIPLNRELDAVWVGRLPLTKLYFAIWVECVPLNGKNIAVQGETPLRTAVQPTAAGMAHIRADKSHPQPDKSHPRRQITSAPDIPHPQPDDA